MHAATPLPGFKFVLVAYVVAMQVVPVGIARPYCTD